MQVKGLTHSRYALRSGYLPLSRHNNEEASYAQCLPILVSVISF